MWVKIPMFQFPHRLRLWVKCKLYELKTIWVKNHALSYLNNELSNVNNKVSKYESFISESSKSCRLIRYIGFVRPVSGSHHF